jgi:hypothetical protein
MKNSTLLLKLELFKNENQKMNKRIVKYLILLLAYIVVVRFIEPYAIKFYFVYEGFPIGTAKSVVTFQAIIMGLELLINLLFALFLITILR